MVEPKLPEGVLLAGVLLRRLAGGLHLVDADRDAERGVRLLPHLRVSPVVRRVRAVDDRIEGRVGLPAVEDVLRLLVHLVADGVRVVPGGRDQEVERLRPRVSRALGHDVEELPVRLGVQLVEDHAVDVEAVLGVGLGGEHLIEAVRRLVDDPLLGGQYLDTPVQRRAHPYHVSSHVEDDGGLLAVGGAAVDLGAFLAVAAAQEQGDSGGELAFPHLLGDLDVGRVELPVAVGLQNPEQVADDALLPVDQLEGLSRPRALGVAELLDEHHREVRHLLVVAGALRHEAGRLVVFQFSHRHVCRLLSGQNKRSPERSGVFDERKSRMALLRDVLG